MVRQRSRKPSCASTYGFKSLILCQWKTVITGSRAVLKTVVSQGIQGSIPQSSAKYPFSPTGQSNGFLIRRLWVRVLQWVPIMGRILGSRGRGRNPLVSTCNSCPILQIPLQLTQTEHNATNVKVEGANPSSGAKCTHSLVGKASDF